MKNYLVKTLPNALAATAYVSLVAFIMFNAEKIVGQPDSFIGPVAILMLFVTSAAIMGILVFGQPVMLYLDGKKKSAIYTLFATVTWLAIITTSILTGLIILG